jgi:rhodanese-related sulfurtransferase
MSTSARSSQALVDEALAHVTTIDVTEALRLQRDEGALLVDLREAAELETEGTIPGAHHAPRGLLEFVVDPQSAWHDPTFADAMRPYVLFCGIGWRSALAARTMQQMGFKRVVHLGGGFSAWKAAHPA